jgi:predicted nuclease of predicted toxin-antitoxin system
LKFLADENVPLLIVGRLRQAGHDVEAVAETSCGATDSALLGRPDISDFVLITFDSDFGELIFAKGLPCPAAIIYTRLNRAAPRYIADQILALIEEGLSMGHMIVISKDGVRTRQFPIGAN